jgi:hypothetical protein
MARTKAQDTTGCEVTGKVTTVYGQRVLRVYISCRNWFDVSEIGIGRANVLASRKGWKMLEGVREYPVIQSSWDNSYQTTRDYTMRLPR